MCGGNKNTTTQQSTSTTAPPGYIQNALQGILGQAQGVSQTPYNPATGQQVAGLTGQQQQAFQDVSNTQGIANPYIQQATNFANQSGAPISASQIANYSNPFQQQVISATQAEMNQNNAQQQQQLQGNAAIQGALGGDREAVAGATLAGQQALANNATLAGLNSQNYSQALGAAQADRTAAGQASYQMGNLGNEAQNAAYTDINQLAQAGSAQQQQQQNVYNAGTANAQQQSQYPFQTTQWLAGILGGLGGLAGGTTTGNSTTTTPAQNPLNALLGLATAGITKLADGGAVPGAGINSPRHFDDGGSVDGLDFDTSGSDSPLLSDNQKKFLSGVGGALAKGQGLGGMQQHMGSPAPIAAAPVHLGGGSNIAASLPYSRPSFADGGNIADVGMDPAVDYGGDTPVPVTSPDAGISTPIPAETSAQPRGLRNNNPGNIEYGPFAKANGATGSDGRFAIFPDAATGQAAMGTLLQSYGTQHGIDTVQGAINRWAPSSENDSNAYAGFVANRLGVSPTDKIDLNDPNVRAKLGQAITDYENGTRSGTNGMTASASNPGLAPSPAAATPAQAARSGLLGNPFNLSDNEKNALATAGFAMMASRSPYLGEAIGQGGLAGLQSLQQEKTLAAQAQKLSNEADFHRIQLGNQAARVAEMQRHNQATEQQKLSAPLSPKSSALQQATNNVIDGAVQRYPGTKREDVPVDLAQSAAGGRGILGQDENGNWILKNPDGSIAAIRQQVVNNQSKRVDPTNVEAVSTASALGKQNAAAYGRRAAAATVLDHSDNLEDALRSPGANEAIGWINSHGGYQNVLNELNSGRIEVPTAYGKVWQGITSLQAELDRLYASGAAAGGTDALRHALEPLTNGIGTAPNTDVALNLLGNLRKYVTGIVTAPTAGQISKSSVINDAAKASQGRVEDVVRKNAPAAAAPQPSAPAIPDGARQMLKQNPALKDQFDAKYGAGSAAAVLGQ